MTENSELEKVMSTRTGAMDMAAARLVSSVGGLMQRALAMTGKRNQEVAQEMRVTPGRITQLLNADGNIKVSTLARFMEACGYEVVISALPKKEGLPSLEPRRRTKRNRSAAPSPVAQDSCRTDLVTTASFDLFFSEFDQLRPSTLLSIQGWNLAVHHWRVPECKFEPQEPTPSGTLYESGASQR
jgi:hypothetical protein